MCAVKSQLRLCTESPEHSKSEGAVLDPYPNLKEHHRACELPAVKAFYASPRCAPLCKYQKDPVPVSGAYEPVNYTYTARIRDLGRSVREQSPAQLD